MTGSNHNYEAANILNPIKHYFSLSLLFLTDPSPFSNSISFQLFDFEALGLDSGRGSEHSQVY